MPKISINAKSVVRDIRSGILESQMMGKYNINPRQLQSLLRQMVMAGYLSSGELREWLSLTQSQVFRALDDTRAAVQELD